MKFIQSNYPAYRRLGAFFSTYLTLVELINTRVFDTFADFCGSPEIARQALALNQNPLILIKQPPEEENFMAAQAAGYFPGGKNPDQIWINPTRANRFEGIAGTPLGIREMELIVLHEMVHWGRYRSGLPALVNGKEAGFEFEKAAYPIDHSLNVCPGYECLFGK